MVDIHLDPQVLSGLQEVMEGEYPKLLDTFLDDSQKRVEALRKARQRLNGFLLRHGRSHDAKRRT